MLRKQSPMRAQSVNKESEVVTVRLQASHRALEQLGYRREVLEIPIR